MYKIDRMHELKKQFENELKNNILNFWVNEVYDSNRKTFFGKITNDGEKFEDAPMSAVFITRILWTFAAVYRKYPTPGYKTMADEAFRIIQEIFWDDVNGGIYWSVYPDGKLKDSKKQFYAQAFLIYALTEYYLAFKNEKAKQLAISMFILVEKYAFDTEFDGYIEANTADWKEPEDQRLSSRDLDASKSMNTHLHILEAYTNLYRIYKDKQVKKQLEHLLRVFLEKIWDSKTEHLILFFEKKWNVLSDIDSYGHDIESAWLLCEAAEVLGDKTIINEVEHVALKISETTLKEGLHKSGGLYYEKDSAGKLAQFDWWPQAEAVIGFFNSWQISQNSKYLDLSVQSWEFIQKYIIDTKNGEWYLGVNLKFEPVTNEKVNSWKAPYHNSRMCLEMIRRIELIEQ